jgi:hypothetical protein
MMKHGTALFSGIIMAAMLVACNNFFHGLVPPEGNRITSFEIDGQTGPARIGENKINVDVSKNTSPHSVLPRVSVSHGATLLPVTLDYVKAAFPSADLLQTVIGMSTAADISVYVMDLIRENPDFTIPSLTIPMDFSGPVTMLVISGQGAIRWYTVEVSIDSGEPRLLGFSFSKYDNAELTGDARSLVSEQGRTVTANAVYPVEMDNLSYALVPSFEILGDGLEIDGIPVVSGVTGIQFTKGPGTKNKIITITRDGGTKDYILLVTFSEDPDTVRSITDFRFTTADNSNIAANAVASITNNDNTGTISAQVFYSGARPSTLMPRFISPGTVSVSGVTQTSGGNSRDFSTPVEYRVVSRNGQYTRVYTVKVEFISLTDNAPQITSFRFSAAQNPELVQDSEAQISDGLILIDARYKGAYAPDTLIPEFTAEGLVTVYGSVQVSGSSAQDFSRQIKYTVTNPLNPLLTRDYWVQCSLARDSSSDAAITSFGFYPRDNTGLADVVMGKIDRINGEITVYAPIGSGLTARTMIPRFTATGQVSVEGTPQTSGQSGQMFNAPVTYTVVSANGLVSRIYVVSVRELQSTIYVNRDAYGYGDGTSWGNAFRDLKSACEAAAQFPGDAPKEIWIAKGTYTPGNADGYFRLTPNTSYIGGFAGHETAKSQREPEANTVTVSGELGGGVYAKRLFAAIDDLDGDLSFENLLMTGVRGGTGFGGSCIYALLESAYEITVTDCDFNDVEASGAGGAIYVGGGGAVISNSAFSACTNGAVYVQGAAARISDVEFSNCNEGVAVWLDCAGDTEITRVNVSDSSANAFSLGGNGNKTIESLTVIRGGQCLNVQNTAGDVRINGLVMRDLTGTGIAMNGANGTKRLSGISGINISGGAIGSTASSGSFTLTGSDADALIFDNTGIISVLNGSGSVSVSDIEIKNSKGPYALSVTANGNAVIDTVTINGVPNGRGIYTGGSGSAHISYAAITGCGSGAGMSLTNSGDVSVSNITIDTVNSDGGITRTGGNLSVVNSVIKNITGRGISSSSSANLEVNGLELQNISGYGIYSSGGGVMKFTNITAVTGIGGDYGIYSISMTNGSFTVSDSKFTSCGVYCDAGSSIVPIQVTDTEIRNATGSEGLYANTGNAAITIDRVTIDGVSNGRGIYAASNNTAKISDSIIKNCVTTVDGGGVYVNGGTLTMNGSTISGNTAGSAGGGVNVKYGNFVMNGGTISDNTAGSAGGGVNVISGNFVMNGGTISDNTASSAGGGVNVISGSFVMNGGTISRNTSRFEGGGVNVYGYNSYFEKTGGSIYGSDGGVDANHSGNNTGHAGYYNNYSISQYSNTTLGPTDNL